MQGGAHQAKYKKYELARCHGVHGLGHDGIDGYADGFDKGTRLGGATAHQGLEEHDEGAGDATQRARRGADQGGALGPVKQGKKTATMALAWRPSATEWKKVS